MLLDVFIFLVPTSISLLVFILSFKFKYNKLWVHTSFAVSFLFIFYTSLVQSDNIDILTIKNDIENIVSEKHHNESIANILNVELSNRHSNPITDLIYLEEERSGETIIKIYYKEKILNGTVLLQNRFYIKDNQKVGK